MYFRQIAIATALYALLAVAGGAARVPALDDGARGWQQDGTVAYRAETDVLPLREESIIP